MYKVRKWKKPGPETPEQAAYAILMQMRNIGKPNPNSEKFVRTLAAADEEKESTILGDVYLRSGKQKPWAILDLKGE